MPPCRDVPWKQQTRNLVELPEAEVLLRDRQETHHGQGTERREKTHGMRLV